MVRVHFGPPLLPEQKRREVWMDRAVKWKNKMARKAALDNMPVACCNRRGFPAGKRVHFGPPLQKEEPLWGVSSAGRAPALQAGGHRFDPGTLHHEEIDWNSNGSWCFIESLKEIQMHLENWTLFSLWCNYEKATVKEKFLIKRVINTILAKRNF